LILNHKIFLTALLISNFLLAACVSTRPVTTLTPLGPAWPAHQATISNLNRWSLSGRIALNDKVNNQSWHANLHWSQQDEDYRIKISGPLGQGQLQISGNDDQATLRTADGEFTDSNAEALLQQTTGLQIPLQGLQYWIKGLPQPQSPQQAQGNGNGQLARLQQNDWLITYISYTQSASFTLPQRIQAEQDQLQVKLFIDKWQTL